MKKLLLGLMLVATQAQAEFMAGNALLQKMNGETTDRLSAISYVMGVADASQGVLWCEPGDQIVMAQVYDLSYRYLVANPEMRHFPAHWLLKWALGEAWPCKSKGLDKRKSL